MCGRGLYRGVAFSGAWPSQGVAFAEYSSGSKGKAILPEWNSVATRICIDLNHFLIEKAHAISHKRFKL